MDRITQTQRSAVMASVASKDTKPEMVVRRILHSLGFRFRLHVPTLPGKPDLVLPRLRKIIFVNGCFWHAHQCRHGKRLPQTNRDYWISKRRRNSVRDRASVRKLHALGWDVLTVWECELASAEELRRTLVTFLE